MFDLVRPTRVLANRALGPDSFVLTMERRFPSFQAGQHIDVGLPGAETRTYSLYSGEGDPHLEILVRRVRGGTVSSQLAVLAAGDQVRVDRPRGKFTLRQALPGEKLLFVATGTGIAPFRSFLRSRPDLDATLVHGVRDPEDDYGAEFAPSRVLCVSGPQLSGGAFAGRVTAWLEEADLGAFSRAYLCGNARMIFEVFPLLVDRGMEEHRVHTETYF